MKQRFEEDPVDFTRLTRDDKDPFSKDEGLRIMLKDSMLTEDRTVAILSGDAHFISYPGKLKGLWAFEVAPGNRSAFVRNGWRA